MIASTSSRLPQHLRDGVVVLDGHDGAGKSTIARLLSEELGGAIVKPFNDSLGDLLVWLIARERFEQANQLALSAVEKCLHGSPVDTVRWFDRHWLSLFTLLPEAYYDAWLPLPPTVLCWADPDVTVRRLIERGEPPGDIEEHRYFCRRYRELAERFDIPVVDTSHSSGEEAAGEVLKLLRA